MGLERGLELIRDGAYFEAHEELEDEWRVAPDPERDFLQGLVHVAVAWLHAERGNRNGCERQLAKAERRLAGYRPSHRGVDVALVLDDVGRARELVSAGSLELSGAARLIRTRARGRATRGSGSGTRGARRSARRRGAGRARP